MGVVMQVNEVSSKIGEMVTPSAQGLRQEMNRSPTREKKGMPEASSWSGKELSWKKEEIEGVVDAVQKFLDRLNVRLVFSIHKETGEVVVKVVDPKTNKVIRQIPPEELLKLQEKLDELLGILFEARA